MVAPRQLNAADIAAFVGGASVLTTGATTARALADRFSETVYPEDFGAIGNGVADDAAAINAAIATGKQVQLGAKTYGVRSPINLPDDGKNFSMTGSGPLSTSIKALEAISAVVYKGTSAGIGRLSNFRVEGNKLATRPLFLKGAHGVRVEAVDVYNAAVGGTNVTVGDAAGAQQAFENFFTNCLWENSSGNYTGGNLPAYNVECYGTDNGFTNIKAANASTANYRDYSTGGNNAYVYCHGYGYPLPTNFPQYTFWIAAQSKYFACSSDGCSTAAMRIDSDGNEVSGFKAFWNPATVGGAVTWDANTRGIVVATGVRFCRISGIILQLPAAQMVEAPTQDPTTTINVPGANIASTIASFALQYADGAATGGPIRGANAVDLQTNRSNATQGATGQFSSVLGGSANTGGGRSSVTAGEGNFNNATYGVAFGHRTQVRGLGSSGFGEDGTDRNRPYTVTFGGNLFATTGDNQSALNSLKFLTTDANPKRLTADASTTVSATGLNSIALPDNSVYAISGQVVARDTVSNDVAKWTVDALIKRGSGAASTALVGTPTVTKTQGDSATSGWAVAVTADATNGCVAVTVTGAAGRTIRWRGRLWSDEVA